MRPNLAGYVLMYLDVWRSGTAHSFCRAVKRFSESKEHRQDCLMSSTQHSTSVFAIGSTLTYLLFFWECATPPHVQIHHCTSLSFTRPSPALVLQVTNVGVRRPGCEATWLYNCPFPCLTVDLQAVNNSTPAYTW